MTIYHCTDNASQGHCVDVDADTPVEALGIYVAQALSQPWLYSIGEPGVSNDGYIAYVYPLTDDGQTLSQEFTFDGAA